MTERWDWLRSVAPGSKRLAQVTRERDEAQRKLARVRARSTRAQQRLAALDGQLQSTRARLVEVDADLALTHHTLDHYMRVAAEQDQRVADGLAVGFDYPYHPRPRTFDRSGRTFFSDLVAAGNADYADLLGDLARHVAPLTDLTMGESDPLLPYWTNPWLPVLDGILLYAMIAQHRPSTYLEVGSGFSTKFARRAVRDHGLDTVIVSIDPQPRAEIDELCDEVIRMPYEDVDLDLFDRLGPDDVLFVDNSHRAFTNSDVTVFFTETLPYLRPGVLYGLHDIFIPADYPAEWNDRFYTEQYLLMSYLLGGAGGDRIRLPVHHVAGQPDLVGILAPEWPLPEAFGARPLVGGSFWMQRT